MPLASTRSSLLAQNDVGDRAAARVRESAILLGCLNHPAVARMVEAELDRLTFLCPDLDAIRLRLLQVLGDTLDDDQPGEDADALATAVRSGLDIDPVSKLTAVGQVRDNPHLRVSADLETALQAVREEIEKQTAVLAAAEEIRDAEDDIEGVVDEGLTWRLNQANTARDAALKRALPDEGSASEDKAGLSAHLQTLIDQQVWLRKKK